MINHFRTLLLGEDGRLSPDAASYPGEEIVDPTWRVPPDSLLSAEESGTLSRLRGLLFGGRPDRACRNLRLHWYMTLLHSRGLYESHVLAADSRVSYMPLSDRDVFFLWLLGGPRTTLLNEGASSLVTPESIQVLGYSLAQAAERLYFWWTVTVVNGTDVRVDYHDGTLGSSASSTSTYTTSPSGTAGPLALPCDDGAAGHEEGGLSILFEPSVGRSWSVSSVLRPSLGLGACARLALAGVDAGAESVLFGPSSISRRAADGASSERSDTAALLRRAEDARRGLGSLWIQEQPFLLDRLALLLLAYGWKREEQRLLSLMQ